MTWEQYVLHPTRISLWQILKQNTSIHTLKSCLCLRYIDDKFTIWKGTKAELMTFIEELNEKHKTIKFDFQILPRKIAFLNAILDKGENKNV